MAYGEVTAGGGPGSAYGEFGGHSHVSATAEFRNPSSISAYTATYTRAAAVPPGGGSAGAGNNPPSPTRVPTYPRSASPGMAAARAAISQMATLSPAKVDNLPPPPAAVAVGPIASHPPLAVHDFLQHHQPRTTSPYRARRPGVAAAAAAVAGSNNNSRVAESRSISPPNARPPPSQVDPSQMTGPSLLQPNQPPVDLTAWRMRLNQMGRDELKTLITTQYDRNCSGSIDFCDFLALWFSHQMFQIRRSSAPLGSEGKESEGFEVQAKHLYRVREVFNEYEESYLGGVRYGLVSAMLKDLMYDQDHEVQHYYGMCTDDMVSLVEELALHRQIRSQPGKEPRYDFAYILQLLFKYITDTEEVALYYDEGCKVFQALRTKEYGEQPIYQNSTISTKLLIKVLTSFKKPQIDFPFAETERYASEDSLMLPTG